MSFFNRINLETPESVELEFTLAGIGNRAYALAIDYLVIGLTITFSIIIFVFITYQVNASGLSSGNREDIIKWIWAIEILLAFAIYVGYFVFFETTWQGQTPGKKRANIRVIADNGHTIVLAKTVLRALLRPIDDLFFLGVFLIVLSQKEKRIGDLFAGTIVIQEDSITQKNTDFIVAPQAQNVANQIAREAEISLLSPENFNIIRNYLQRRTMMNYKAQRDVARRLALQVQDIVKLETIPENTTANLFLEAIYLAYQNIEH